MDVLGTALLDYQQNNYTEDISTYSSLDLEDTLPLPYLFRNFTNMPLIEQKALKLCKGSILDIGCGAGSHSLYLQQNGFEVMAIDSSEGAIQTCRLRGVNKTTCQNINDFKNQKFDTLLLLMNGIGLAQNLRNLSSFLKHLKSLLNPNGQILLDSSDIIYMFDNVEKPKNHEYYGEIDFILNYKNLQSEPFQWLYLDQAKLKEAAKFNQLNCEIVSLGEHFDFLARLTIETQ